MTNCNAPNLSVQPIRLEALSSADIPYLKAAVEVNMNGSSVEHEELQEGCVALTFSCPDSSPATSLLSAQIATVRTHWRELSLKSSSW